MSVVEYSCGNFPCISSHVDTRSFFWNCALRTQFLMLLLLLELKHDVSAQDGSFGLITDHFLQFDMRTD